MGRAPAATQSQTQTLWLSRDAGPMPSLREVDGDGVSAAEVVAMGVRVGIIRGGGCEMKVTYTPPATPPATSERRNRRRATDATGQASRCASRSQANRCGSGSRRQR